MSLRRALLVVLILLLVVGAGSWWWLWHTASGARFIWARAENASAGALQLQQLAGNLADGLKLQGLRYSAGTTDVTAGRLHASVSVGLMPLVITVSEARVQDLAVTIRSTDDAESNTDIAELLQALELPFVLQLTDLHVEGLQVQVEPDRFAWEAQSVHLAGRWSEHIVVEELLVSSGSDIYRARGNLQLKAPQRYELHADISSALVLPDTVEGFALSAEVQGGLDDYSFESNAQAQVAQLGNLQATMHGRGDFSGLVFEQLRVTGDTLALAANGGFRWSNDWHLHAKTEIERFDPTPWIADWPVAHPVSGNAQLKIDAQQLAVQALTLDAAGTPAQLTGNGLLDFTAGNVVAELAWSKLRWPLVGETSRISSEQGRIDVAGALDDWKVHGSVALAAAGVEDGRFDITGGGNRDKAAAQISNGNVLGGKLTGAVSASWRGARPWSAELDLAGIRPDALWPESAWAGRLSGHVDARGQAEPLLIDLDLDEVQGRFMGRALTANGAVEITSDSVTANRFRLTHGGNEILLDGNMDSPAGIRFSARAEQLELYQSIVSGDLRAAGNLRMHDREPVLELKAESALLGIANTQLENVVLALDGTGSGQQLSLGADIEEFRLQLSLAGALDDWREPTRWLGRLEQLELQGPERRMMHLLEPALVSVAASDARVERLCFAGAYDSHVCGELNWVADQSLDLIAEIEALPVNHINQFVDTGYLFNQLLTGRVEWHTNTGRPASGIANISLSPGQVRSAGREEFALLTGAGTAALNIHDGVLLDGELHLPLPGTGRIDGEFSLLDIVNYRDSELSGAVNVVADNIGFLRVFMPMIDAATGRLNANVELAGTVAEPLLLGEVSLLDASLSYRPLGLKLQDIELQSTFDEARRFDLRGSFRAGQGRGVLTSRGDYETSIQSGLEVELRGEQLTLIDVPDVQAVADADLRLGFADGTLRIDGKLGIPRARVSPKSLPATRYSESDDVVVVAGELPAEREAAAGSNFRINGALEVELGDDVVVDLDIAKATVTGSTRFVWQNSLIPTANGRYDIAGDVQAYGQVLTIAEGAIRFPKVPADNPYIRMRAEREIFGNSQIKRAGILVDGTVKRPTVEPYTEPVTTEERALTLLVTGSDFDLEQGIGAIDFGTYIAPKLFVSYGVGLFDQENVISARYDLGKSFGIKATSGQKESGVDLIYRIER